MASSKGGGGGGGGIPLERMSVEQLRALKEQADLEVNLLQDSLTNIRTATTRLEIASSALNDLSLRPHASKMLVPLTASLYVPGTLDDSQKVLVDVGTGYFIEKTMAEGKDYCERKINLLKSNFDQLVEGRLLTGATIGIVIAGGAYVSTVDEATFCGWLFSATKLVNPFFALLDAEFAHTLAVSAAARGWVPREKRVDPPIIGLEVWGRKFSNPVGLAAGFDKNAEAVDGLLGMGFGFVEVGSVTPVPQDGNPKPRIFRLRQEGAIINRCGFNSQGIVAVAKRLGAQHGKRKLDETSSSSRTSNNDVKHGGKAGPGILGVNLGKNKTSEDAAADYVQGVHTLSQYADYLVINVSSPNTPGLRMLQGRKQLKDLVKKIQAARDEMQWGDEGPPPLLVKIAPDLSKDDLEDIAAVAVALNLDGLIISNTTISRPDTVSSNPLASEAGGLSGKPLFDLSTNILKQMYMLTRGKIPLIGCGGISSGEDAYKKIRSGATLVQLYTAFAYGGPALIPQIKAELAECLERDGFKSILEAVGADCR